MQASNSVNMISTQSVKRNDEYDYEFTVCTFVTRHDEYEEMLASFELNGFNNTNSEFLYIDNSTQNELDCYEGINTFLQKAKGRYIIICHQDIVLIEHGYDHLLEKIKEIQRLDPKWAILSNAGCQTIRHISMHLRQGGDKDYREKLLPLKSITIDEHFIVVKNSANLAMSGDLNGFHMYGTDICLIADILGYNTYIIDFFLMHKSHGNPNESFIQSKANLIKKYDHALRGRFLRTTITKFYTGGNGLARWFWRSTFGNFIARKYYKHFRSKAYFKPKDSL